MVLSVYIRLFFQFAFFGIFFLSVLLKATAVEDLTIKDFWQNNVTMKAVDVISSFINQMKDKLVNELIRRPLGYNDNDIQWVITTPGKLEPPINELMYTAVTKVFFKVECITIQCWFYTVKIIILQALFIVLLKIICESFYNDPAQ